jgi:uncharacterized protein YndB with AHSA1/START domain
VKEATRELLAPREDVWAFLAEPYHLSDWWPGVTGVEPDRRGFAPGARWKVQVARRNVITGPRTTESLLLVQTVEPFERCVWHLLATKTELEVRLRTSGPDRTLVTVAMSKGMPDTALRRLYDLVQTAATM